MNFNIDNYFYEYLRIFFRVYHCIKMSYADTFFICFIVHAVPVSINHKRHRSFMLCSTLFES